MERNCEAARLQHERFTTDIGYVAEWRGVLASTLGYQIPVRTLTSPCQDPFPSQPARSPGRSRQRVRPTSDRGPARTCLGLTRGRCRVILVPRSPAPRPTRRSAGPACVQAPRRAQARVRSPLGRTARRPALPSPDPPIARVPENDLHRGGVRRRVQHRDPLAAGAL